MNTSFSNQLFDKMPIIGIMRNIPDKYVELIAKNYFEAGLTCLEITMNSDNAEKNISALVELFGGKLNIGAGTVCSMNDLEKAILAKAQFIVTPIINEEVIKTCVDANIPIFPGAYTPTEIYKAWSLGAKMIKIFPAGNLRPGYIKEVLAPLNQVHLMPTGGVTLGNLTDHFADGAKAVGVGSQLFPKDIIGQENWEALRDVYTQFVKKYTGYIQNKNCN